MDIPKITALNTDPKVSVITEMPFEIVDINNMLFSQRYFVFHPGVSLSILIYVLIEVIKSTH